MKKLMQEWVDEKRESLPKRGTYLETAFGIFCFFIIMLLLWSDA